MDLAKAFREEVIRRKDDEWFGLLGSVAKFAASPWDLGEVRIMIDDGQNAFSIRSIRTIWIEFNLFPDYPFRFQFDEWAAMDASNPHAYLVEQMHQPLFDHLRYRPALPVDDHIILGEE